MMIAGALFVVVYTFVGGFLAESASDFMQGIVMIIALILICILGINSAGGLGVVIENAKAIPGYFSLNQMATPQVDASGVQQVVDGILQFGAPANYGLLTIISMLSWGLGYFGVPQVLIIAIIGVVIAWDEKSVIFTIVSFAWAGFGATFGPIMLFSLFWKRVNRNGAIAGMLSGGIMVFVWKLASKRMGGVFAIYELLPAFIVS